MSDYLDANDFLVTYVDSFGNAGQVCMIAKDPVEAHCMFAANYPNLEIVDLVDRGPAF